MTQILLNHWAESRKNKREEDEREELRREEIQQAINNRKKTKDSQQGQPQSQIQREGESMTQYTNQHIRDIVSVLFDNDEYAKPSHVQPFLNWRKKLRGEGKNAGAGGS